MNTYEVLYGTINGQKIWQTVELSKEEATALGSDYVKLVKSDKKDATDEKSDKKDYDTKQVK